MDEVIEIEETNVTRPGRSRHNNSAVTVAPPSGTILLGPRDRLSGELHIESDLRIQGEVSGKVQSAGDIDVESPGRVHADIEGGSITVHGSVTGNVVARRRLLLAGSGSITGEVRTPKLQVDDGAVLNGTITMSAAEPPSSPSTGDDGS